MKPSRPCQGGPSEPPRACVKGTVLARVSKRGFPAVWEASLGQGMPRGRGGAVTSSLGSLGEWDLQDGPPRTIGWGRAAWVEVCFPNASFPFPRWVLRQLRSIARWSCAARGVRGERLSPMLLRAHQGAQANARLVSPGDRVTREILDGPKPVTRFLFSALPTLTRSPGRGVTGDAQGTGPRRPVIVCSVC